MASRDLEEFHKEPIIRLGLVPLRAVVKDRAHGAISLEHSATIGQALEVRDVGPWDKHGMN